MDLFQIGDQVVSMSPELYNILRWLFIGVGGTWLLIVVVAIVINWRGFDNLQ